MTRPDRIVARSVIFPPAPTTLEELGRWTRQVTLELEVFIRRLVSTLDGGNVLFQVVSAIPGTGDIGEGAFYLYEVGATRRLYTKVNGSIRYVTLT